MGEIYQGFVQRSWNDRSPARTVRTGAHRYCTDTLGLVFFGFFRFARTA